MTAPADQQPQAGSPSPARRQEQEQATADVDEVAPGVVRMQLPIDLPGLGHVNCYALEDERGLALVDPGLPGEQSWTDLSDRLARAGYRVADVHTVVITHSHFDHFGGSSRLHEETGAEIVTHASFRVHWNGKEMTEDEDSSSLVEASADEQEAEIDRIFSERLPWGSRRTRPPDQQIERFKALGRFAGTWFRTPDPTATLQDAQVIRLARREWVALPTPGHTHDHLCVFDPEHGVVLSGDHVLPTITPHIAGLSLVPDPLAQFFESLQRMGELDGVRTVLPAHGHPFEDLAGRAAEIIDHHEHRLQVIRDASAQLEQGTVTDFMRILFSERAWGDMAESETYAHLEHLLQLGELRRSDPGGVAHYRPA